MQRQEFFAKVATLTTRETTAFCGIARGMSSREIAGMMDIAVKTAENFRSRVIDKMGCSSLQIAIHTAKFGIV